MGAARPFRQAGEMWSRKDSSGELRKPEHGPECAVNVVHLGTAERAGGGTETRRIDGYELLDEHARCTFRDLDLRSEPRRCGGGRRGRDDDRREGDELVSLEHNAVPGASLLMSATSPRRFQPIDLTTVHGTTP